jgi:RNA polymerase sigma-70 factor (ECF subfamily)
MAATLDPISRSRTVGGALIPSPQPEPAGAASVVSIDDCPTTSAQEPQTTAAGVQPTFEDVFDWHEAEIFRFALRLTGSQHDADDLFQETMLKAFRAFDRLQPNSNHRAWLYRIASNTFLSGKRKFDRIDSLDLLGEQLNFEVAVAEADHAAGLDARDLLQEIRLFVEHLPPKQRIALVLRKFHGLGYDDVAVALGCTEGAARTNVHQALRKVREAFEDRL